MSWIPSAEGREPGRGILVLQIAAGVVALGLLATGIALEGYEYNERISSAICLACLGLNPVSELDFTFDTANGADHPSWVLEPLRERPVFIEYTQSVGCASCDVMKPVIEDLMDEYSDRVDFIIIDQMVDERVDTFGIYDVLERRGFPTFIIVTLSHEGGDVRPYFGQATGIVPGGDLAEALNDALALHLQHRYAYEG